MNERMVVMTVVRRCDAPCRWNVLGNSYACDHEQVEITRDGKCSDFQHVEPLDENVKAYCVICRKEHEHVLVQTPSWSMHYVEGNNVPFMEKQYVCPITEGMFNTDPELVADNIREIDFQRGIVREFQGDYRWLSNFHMCSVKWAGKVYPSAEHAYQASKTMDWDERNTIARMNTPGQAKRAGRALTMRPDWDNIKRGAMRDIVEAKFRQNPDLAERLLYTGEATLEEGNRWGDTYWGVDLRTGKGENHLGRILMTVRTILREERRRGK